MQRIFRQSTAVSLGLLAVSVAGPALAEGVTTRISVRSDGAQANGESVRPAISSDGRIVSFSSDASNLVAGDINGVIDVFVHNRADAITTLISVGSGGRQGNNYSDLSSISPGGRFVAYQSEASDLVAGDTNNSGDIFVRDRQAGITRRASVGPSGQQGNGFSSAPSISGGGRFVAFYSFASNLVPGDTRGTFDIFVRDRQGETTTRASVGPGGQQANDFSFSPSISTDGRFVAFSSDATNLVPGDTNGSTDLFVRDRPAKATRRVSVGPDGRQGNAESFGPSISADGRFVAFSSEATNLVSGDTNARRDIFVRDRQAGTTTRVSVGPNGRQGNGGVFGSSSPSISADGRIVAFVSDLSNLVPDDTNEAYDIFVHELAPQRASATVTRAE